MSLRHPIIEREGEQTLGMDSTSPLTTMKPGYVREAYNCFIGAEAGYTKRGGFASQLSSAWSTRKITSGIEYTSAGLTQTRVLFGTDGTATGGILGYIDAGAVTSITTGYSGTARMALVQFGDLLFGSNGSDSPFVYNGTATRQVGIPAPASVPTFAQSAGGSLTQTASYVYAYTYYNSVTGAESTPSGFASITLTGANNRVTVTVVAGSSTTANYIRIWRTAGNGLQLFLSGSVSIATTTYVDDIADSALTTALELDNSRITDFSSTPKFPFAAANRMFWCTGTNEWRWSKIGQSGAMPESYQVIAGVDTQGRNGTNDQSVGGGAAGDTPVILKQDSVGVLVPTTFNNPLSPSDQVLYEYKEVSNVIGAVSHFGVTSCFDECVFLSKDNIYAINSEGALRPVADAIQATIRDLGFTSSQRAFVSAANYTKKRCLMFAVYSSSSADTPSYILKGDYQKYPNFRWTIDRPGTNVNTHPALKIGCLFQVTNSTDGTKDVWAGNASANGQVYQYDSGTSDPGSLGIYFSIKSRPYSMQAPETQKLFKKTFIDAQGNGNAYNLSVSGIYNLSDEEETVHTLSLSSGGYVWDNVSSEWGTATWASNEIVNPRYAAHKKARYLQLVIRQTEASAPVTLYGWQVSASRFAVY